jgi:superfamily II RNA helicase
MNINTNPSEETVQMTTIVSEPSDPTVNLAFLSKYSHLDPFQIVAFETIDNYNPVPVSVFSETTGTTETKYDPLSENILITAHTGSGKSLPAEYAIYNTVKQRKLKVIYTSPIKSLSNQKFYDFNEKFSEYKISIGILTGDIKFAPQADCIIMTTEILLNQLHKYQTKKQVEDSLTLDLTLDLNSANEVKESNTPSNSCTTNFTPSVDIDFSQVGCIIFDEVHYINDADRGNVWEQSIMYIPTHIQLIMLSATLNQPEKFGKWIESVQKKKTKIISTNHRVVPLHFNMFYSMTQGNIKKVPKDKINGMKFNELIPLASTVDKIFNDLMYQKVLKFNEYQLKQISGNKWYPSSIINEMLKIFNHENYEENMFPLLFFVLNKKKCIELARSVNITFNTGAEQAEVDAYIKSMVGSKTSPFNYLKQMDQFTLVSKLAQKGIGIHHSGLLPVLKEIVEQLYEKKLIKVLFATETFAVGLNMPTKTVVFSDLSKYSSEGQRLLYSHEFIQMAGRAGRRNIDTKGYIILLPQLFRNQLTNPELTQMLYGGGQKIVSKLNIDELFILRQLASAGSGTGSGTGSGEKIDIAKLSSNIRSSMLADNAQAQIAHQQNIVTKHEQLVSTITTDDKKQIQELITLTNPVFSLTKDQHKRLNVLKSNPGLMTKFNAHVLYTEEVDKLNDMINHIEIAIRSQLNNLVQHNMVEYDKTVPDSEIILTNRGIIGSYIIDQNPIILVDILTSDFFKQMIKTNSVADSSSVVQMDSVPIESVPITPTKDNLYNIISLLSTITFDDHITDPIDFEGFKHQNMSNSNIKWIDFLDQLFDKYRLNGSTSLIEKFNFDYVWLVDEYMRTSVYPTNQNDKDHLFEGNFVRSINRLLNLLNELRTIAEETENKQMMNIFDECRIELLRDKAWLVPDSIYLRKCGFTLDINASSNTIQTTDKPISLDNNFDDVFAEDTA